MKLAIVFLLGLFALSANANYNKDHSDIGLSNIATFKDEVAKPGFFDGLRDSMEQKVKELAKTYIRFLEGQLNTLITKFVAKFSSLAQYSLYNVDKMARDARTGFLLADDKYSLPCFNEHREEFESSQYFARAGVEQCTVEATLELNVVRKNVTQHIDSIETAAENINNILKQCLNIFKPISTTKCIFNNVSSIIKSIEDIVSSAMDAIKSGGQNLSKVVSDTKQCIELDVTAAEQNTTMVINDIKKCIEIAHNATIEPPVTQPPATQPPATQSPTTQPPATQSPATQPPATHSPATQPPAHKEPTTKKATTQPPRTEEPTNQASTHKKPAPEEA